MKKLIVLFLILSCPCICSGSWQTTLDSNFDVVETFDNLNIWTANTVNPPEYINGGISRWTILTNFSEDFGPELDSAIKNHGPYTWSPVDANSKSLCIDYYNFNTTIPGNTYGQYGPDRIGMFLGDGVTGKSGYKKIHIFMMVKFPTGAFAPKPGTPGEYEYIGTFKWLEVASGFTSGDFFGTVAENATVINTEQSRNIYGVNYTIMNWAGGGSTYGDSLHAYEAMRFTVWDGSHWTIDPYNPLYSKNRGLESVDFTSIYESNQWLGIEYVIDIGTPDAADGSINVSIYNESGVLIGSYSDSNYQRLAHFDHYINKIVLGGNRFGSSYEPDAGDVADNRVFVDDFIIDDQEIAPAYFALLAGEEPPTYDPPTITGPADFSTTSTSVEIEGTYTVDSELTANTVTWTLGESSGFCVAALGVFSCTVPVELGANSIVFTVTDSNAGTDSDTTVVTRTAVPQASITSTSISHGVLRH